MQMRRLRTRTVPQTQNVENRRLLSASAAVRGRRLATLKRVKTDYPSIRIFRTEARIGECWRSLAAAWGSIPSNEGTLRHDSISENGRPSTLGSSHVLGHAQNRDRQPG
ncbi:uncharacterized protein TrAtP1_003107 [Trichoderma atroviride]|uniref:uncharacterized protein n=1 Tax=Hypocrea atroviridis TaxID=63577 RepID=UPI00332DB634|nr:hypothetical protein TrAtP1_003107 [Trichoderma atroviride]